MPGIASVFSSVRSRIAPLFVVGLLCGLAGRCPAADPPGSATAPTNQTFTFAVFGDNRPADATKPIPPVFKRILTELKATHPAFVLTTGDLILGSKDAAEREKMYDEVIPLIQSVGVPFYFTPGNHEMRGGAEAEAAYKRRVCDKLYYSFEYGSGAGRCHFAMLDSEIVGQENRITGEQLDWLDKDLAAAQSAHVGHLFVLLHEQPFPVANHIGSSLDKYPKERDAFQAVLEKYKIDALITGHEHLFDDSVHGGVREIIAGGAGAPIHATRRGGGFHHYLLVTVDGPKVNLIVVKPGSLFAAEDVLNVAPAEKASDADVGKKLE